MSQLLDHTARGDGSLFFFFIFFVKRNMGSRAIVQVHNGKSVNLLACIYPSCKFGKTCQAHPSSFRVYVRTYPRMTDRRFIPFFAERLFRALSAWGKQIRQSFAGKYL